MYILRHISSKLLSLPTYPKAKRRRRLFLTSQFLSAGLLPKLRTDYDENLRKCSTYLYMIFGGDPHLCYGLNRILNHYPGFFTVVY